MYIQKRKKWTSTLSQVKKKKKNSLQMDHRSKNMNYRTFRRKLKRRKSYEFGLSTNFLWHKKHKSSKKNNQFYYKF